MAVWCRQVVDGLAAEPTRIEPHTQEQTDGDLLAAKERGARDKGWKVKRTGPRSFTATKKRWTPSVVCVREFWADG